LPRSGMDLELDAGQLFDQFCDGVPMRRHAGASW
jgi:hypothetical protein